MFACTARRGGLEFNLSKQGGLHMMLHRCNSEREEGLCWLVVLADKACAGWLCWRTRSVSCCPGFGGIHVVCAWCEVSVMFFVLCSCLLLAKQGWR